MFSRILRHNVFSILAMDKLIYQCARVPCRICRLGLLYGPIFLVNLFILTHAHEAKAAEWIYTVRPGDNLWNLTEQHLISIGLVYRLQKLNRIQNPYQIPPGTEIRIPFEWARQQSSQARVISVNGDAMVRRQSTFQKIPIVQGMQLFAGDEVSTGQDAFVMLEFADRSLLRIQAESKARFNRLEVLGDEGMVNTEVDLQYGRTENTVPKNPDINSRFQITSPSAVSSVRGTDFRMGTAEEGMITYSEVLAGRVQVSGSNRSIRVSEGFGSVTKLNEAPSRPVKLLSPPDLSVTPQLYGRMPLTIPLKPLINANAYRVQIAADNAFKNLLTDFISVSVPLRGGELPDGDYWLRIRGRDNSGLEGYEAVMPIKIKARPEPPFVIAPQNGMVVEDQNPVLQWTTRPDITHYILTISQEADFSLPVISESQVTGNHFRVTVPLAPGNYLWRIASVSEAEGIGPFSDPISFRVPMPGPLLESTDIADREITFSWPSAAEGQHFQFQFARDKAFQTILTDMQTYEPRVTLPRPDSGSYYLRIKVIEADGTQGSFSPAQIVEIPSKYPYWLFLLLPLLGLLL